MKYEPTIGLEIHAELKTRTKMFCNSMNDPDEKRPNVNVCPICMAHPGTLPVINKEAVKKVLMTGKALKGKLADYSRFDRKNYFYPDLPKGYQISQYKYPLVKGGYLEIPRNKIQDTNKFKIQNSKIKITRIHLEEDTGKLIHSKDGSLVDFNRAGVPLMELVTEPDIKSGEQARKFAEELQLILRYLNVSDADMEKGQMRVEANISLKPTYDVGCPTDIVSRLGTKVEIKNLNSFRAVEQAINYEIERQTEILESGKKVIQETRGWNENKKLTFSQREKEESHDYRYFPEPDLPSLQISNIKFQISNLPELPQEKRERFKKDYGLRDEDIEMYIRNDLYCNFFETVAKKLEGDKEAIILASNYITSDIAGKLKTAKAAEIPAPDSFAKLIKMTKEKKISSRGAKDILHIILEKGGDPESIAKEKNLFQMSDESEIEKVIERIIKENPKVVDDCKKGKETALQFLIGQGMKITKGSANPEVLKGSLKKKLFGL